MRMILEQSQKEDYPVYEKFVEVGIVKDQPDKDFHVMQLI